ncbi:MAG: HlyD family efflux transporter periplasmic adaptor subunit, partial [bacterium]
MQAAASAAEAEAARRALALERTRVRAPAAGVVMVRNAVPGMAAGAMQDAKPLIELYDPARLQVRADMPLADAGRVVAGDRAEVTA